MLFIGPPASAKTLFLLGILDISSNGVYFDGSNTTNRILDILEEQRPNIICLDEIDKMSRQFQNQLLNFMESGRVKVDQQRKRYDFEIKGAKVFASSERLTGYQNPCNLDSGSSFYQDIQRLNSCMYLKKFCLNSVPVLPGILEIVYGKWKATSEI